MPEDFTSLSFKQNFSISNFLKVSKNFFCGVFMYKLKMKIFRKYFNIFSLKNTIKFLRQQLSAYSLIKQKDN